MKDLMAIALRCMVHDEFEAMRSQDAVMKTLEDGRGKAEQTVVIPLKSCQQNTVRC